MDTSATLTINHGAYYLGGRGPKLLVVLRVHRDHLNSGHQLFNHE